MESVPLKNTAEKVHILFWVLIWRQSVSAILANSAENSAIASIFKMNAVSSPVHK